MCRLILKFFLFILISVNIVKAQQAKNFVDPTNLWYEFGQYGGYGVYPKQNVHIYYYFSGDTLINGKNYKKLCADRRDTIYQNPIYLQNSTKVFKGAFRQDFLKVYFVKPNSTNELIYCDFDLHIGSPLNYYYISNATVTAIDSIPFGSNYRRRYKLSSGFHFYDGAAFSLGLFHNTQLGIEGGEYLTCFRQNGITQNVYDLNGIPPSCNLTNYTGFSEDEILNEILLYPNPTNDYIYIRDFITTGKQKILITDIPGNKVLQQEIYSNKIIVSDLSKGVYFFKLYDGDKVYMGKFLKE